MSNEEFEYEKKRTRLTGKNKQLVRACFSKAYEMKMAMMNGDMASTRKPHWTGKKLTSELYGNTEQSLNNYLSPKEKEELIQIIDDGHARIYLDQLRLIKKHGISEYKAEFVIRGQKGQTIARLLGITGSIDC